jgi:4-hydroxy-tetrahydrodipicolinate reductase
MKLALIGYGAMGKLIANLASAAGDEIGLTITSRDSSQNIAQLSEQLRGHDVAIDFSAGAAVTRNVEACARAGVPLVEGTTGWHDKQDEVRRIVAEYDGSLVYGANFSIGVNVFYRIVAHAAELMTEIDQYDAFIEEEHHSRKRDAPSGTALELKKLMTKHITSDVPIASLRAGHIPGTHRVGFDSPADQITLTHMARSREGFAAGALLAARWIVGRKGVFEFSGIIDQMLRASSDEVSTTSQ